MTIAGDAVPFLLDNVRAFETWADAKPPDVVEPPRGVGFHSTSLRGVRFQRFTSPYTPWMVQRPLDAYHALSPHARSQVDRALEGTGVEALLQFSPRHRVAKRNFKLVLAAA